MRRETGTPVPIDRPAARVAPPRNVDTCPDGLPIPKLS